MKVSVCRFCGAPIIWGTEKGFGAVPLNPKPEKFYHVYKFDGKNAEQVDDETILVSHLATCKKKKK